MKKLFLFLSVAMGWIACDQTPDLILPGENEKISVRVAEEAKYWLEIGPIGDLLTNDYVLLEAYLFSSQNTLPDEIKISFFYEDPFGTYYITWDPESKMENTYYIEKFKIEVNTPLVSKNPALYNHEYLVRKIAPNQPAIGEKITGRNLTVEIMDNITKETIIYETEGYNNKPFPHYEEIKTTSATYYITFFGGEWTVFD